MKKRVKRILSLCLAAVIVATSAGYGPPVIGAVTATPSTATKTTEYMATPSEAIPLEEKSTPSEATPSEAERKFVRVDPEEIPEYTPGNRGQERSSGNLKTAMETCITETMVLFRGRLNFRSGMKQMKKEQWKRLPLSNWMTNTLI